MDAARPDAETTKTQVQGRDEMAENLLEEMCLNGNAVTYRAGHEFNGAFLRRDLWLTYHSGIDLASLPPTVLIVPFILNVLPIVLFSGRTYRLVELDTVLAEGIESARSYFAQTHPQISWTGSIVADRYIDTPMLAPAGATGPDLVALCYSGGVDSLYSLFAHLEREPSLITLRGGPDIPLSAGQRWAQRRNMIEATAAAYGLDASFVEGNSLDFIAYEKLPLHSWWTDAQFGLSRVGVALPVAYARGAGKLIFASSGTPRYLGHASTHPDLEGKVHCAGVRVENHGHEVERQAKIEAIVRICRERTLVPPSLRVCVRNRASDENCMDCEKCLRTLNALIVEGAEPKEYGFNITIAELRRRTRARLTDTRRGLEATLAGHWKAIQHRIRDRLRQNEHALYTQDVRGHLEWISSIDLDSLVKWHERRGRRRGMIKSVLKPFPRVIRYIMEAERRGGKVR